MNQEKRVKKFLKRNGIKIRNYSIYEEGDYAIDTYEDLFMGMWIGNETIYYKGAEIMHATLRDGARKKEELPQRLKDILDVRAKLTEAYRNGTREPPIKTGTLKELIEDMTKGADNAEDS